MDYYIIPVDGIDCEESNISFQMRFEDLDLMRFYQKDALGPRILDDGFQYMFGHFHLDRLKKGNYLIAQESVKDDFKKIKHSEGFSDVHNQKMGALNIYYNLSHLYLFSLWLIKDNSVNTPFGIYFNPELGGIPVTNNRIFTNSRGVYENIIFTKEDLERAYKWFEILCGFFVKRGSKNKQYGLYTTFGPEINHNTSSFKRAVSYVEQARNTSFLPAKISFYISVLETVFVVTDSNAYKTPERTSVFLGGDLEERRNLFKIVKNSYDVRSSYVHGSDVYKKHNKRLDEISNDLDNVVRNVLIKIFISHQDLDYEGDDYKRVNQYFIDLLLGGRIND